ncbi:ArdC-like ssDNA-binding domain-containing protein [Crocosphaera sp. Alani8]|uniref:ArdC-like ssDNA-binding domain-containing protein n=1 Tax=Crocosphaera sp. Alani8 TaxID=3038952 RepID=UPI00313ED114
MVQKTNKTALAFEQLEQGLAELLESGDWQRYLKTQSQFHNYSFNNVMLILSQFPEASRVAGYQRWQELGRQVKKGTKSIKILAPLKRKIEKENEKGELEAKTGIFGFRTVNVFDISQTEGDELPEIVSPLTGDDQGFIDRLTAFSHHNQVPVFFKGLLGRANGCCRYDGQTGDPIEIVVDPLLPKQHQTKTLAHEIGHSILHSRTQYDNHIPRSQAELEAESVAFIVLNYFGIDSSDYSFAYVASWQQGEDALENLRQSGMSIQKAANQIIDWIETNFQAQLAA